MPATAVRRTRTRRESLLADFLADLGPIALLSAEEEIELGRRAQTGDQEAIRRLVVSNIPLVISLARHFTGRGLPFDDLVGFGIIGLIRSTRDFDPERGRRFSTHAGNWIKSMIRRAICDLGRPIRLPVHVQEKIIEWDRATARLRDATGDLPDPVDVARSLGWVGLRAGRVELVRLAVQTWACGGQEVSAADDDLTPSVWAVPAPDGEPGNQLADEELADRRSVLVTTILDRLPDREAAVLRLRFGLAGEPPMTVIEVARRLGRSRVVVYKFQQRGLERAKGILRELGEAI